MKELSLNVGGMDCTGCELRIQTALSRVDGVVRSKADRRSGVVTVVINPAKVSEDAVRSSIRQAGYEVSS